MVENGPGFAARTKSRASGKAGALVGESHWWNHGL